MLVLVHAPELLRIVMTASSTTARCLSLAVLLLSLAPLASIYVLIFSFFWGTPPVVLLGGGDWDGSTNTAAPLDLAELARNPTALEELWQLLYQEATRHPINPGLQHPLVMALKELSRDPAASRSHASLTVHHWSVVLPWMLTFILGVVVPTVLSLWSFWRQYRKPRRRARALQKLARFTRTLTADDHVVVEEEETRREADENCKKSTANEPGEITTTTTTQETTTQWLLPRPGVSSVEQSQDPQTLRIVPDSCVVCLHPYQVSERVSWSANAACVHCFHTDCLQTWLRRSNQMECPCCRREFLAARSTD
jgi:hypothetical protein